MAVKLPLENLGPPILTIDGVDMPQDVASNSVRIITFVN